MNLLIRYAGAVLPWLAVVAGLVLPAVAPEIANTTTIVLMALAIVVCWRSDWQRILSSATVALPLLAGVLLVIAFAITAKSAWHIGIIVVLAPLFLVAPLTALFERLPTRHALTALAVAALLGSLGAALVACYDTQVLHMARAGFSVANPIHFADISLMLGCIPLLGLAGRRAWWRLVFLAGPMLGIIAVLLSGSRGPILAVVPVTAAFVLLALHRLMPNRWFWVGLGAFLLAIAAAIGIGSTTGWLQSQPIVANILDVVRTGASPDGSTTERLSMYKTAWSAFLASPFYGHGMLDFIAITATYAPPGVVFPSYEHLHNDIADFAVIGGLLGLVAYALLIVAPLVAVWRLPPGQPRFAVLLLAVPLTIGYFSMGLTNALFGILSLTVLYAVGLSLIAFLSGPKASLS
ncbi:MAG: O-antigen ligase family protein [Devosia sp.]